MQDFSLKTCTAAVVLLVALLFMESSAKSFDQVDARQREFLNKAGHVVGEFQDRRLNEYNSIPPT